MDVVIGEGVEEIGEEIEEVGEDVNMDGDEEAGLGTPNLG